MAVQRPGALRSGETTTCEEGAEAPRGTPYDTDFALWATEQAHFLKQRRATALDWDNLAEEVEALAKSDKRTIRSHLENALLHALKLAYWEAERKGATRICGANTLLTPATGLPKSSRTAPASEIIRPRSSHRPMRQVVGAQRC